MKNCDLQQKESYSKVNVNVCKIFNVVLCGLVICIFTLNYFLYSNSTFNLGALQEYQNDLVYYSKQNELMRNELTSKTSVKNLRQTALLMGYVDSPVDHIDPVRLASR